MKSSVVLSPYGMSNSIATCGASGDDEAAESFYKYDTRFKSGLVVRNRAYLCTDVKDVYWYGSGYQEEFVPDGANMKEYVMQDVRSLTGGRLPNIVSVCSDECVFVNIIDLDLESDDHSAKVLNLPKGDHLYRKGYDRFALYVTDMVQDDSSLYHDFDSANIIDLPAFSVIATIESKANKRGQATNFIFDSSGVSAVSATYYGIHVQHTALNNRKEGVPCHFVLKDEVTGHILFKGRTFL